MKVVDSPEREWPNPQAVALLKRAILKKAVVCISPTGSDAGGGSTLGASVMAGCRQHQA